MLFNMIVYHFRMFTIRSYNLTEGFDESLRSSVDYDLYLKISSISNTIHINKIVYERTLHEKNISKLNPIEQNKNKYKSLKNNISSIIELTHLDDIDIKEIKNSTLVSIKLK